LLILCLLIFANFFAKTSDIRFSEEEELGPEELAAYRAQLAQFVQDNEESIRREQDKRREKVQKI